MFVTAVRHIFSAGRRFVSMDTPSIDIQEIRAKYLNKQDPFLIEEKLPTTNPFELFDIWFKEIASISDLSFEEINAVCVSTVGNDLRPSSRMVLLKSYNADGFSFFTNYNSRKGQQIGQNPNASMLFYWPKTSRQVRIEGEIDKLPEDVALKYWNSRPLPSRIGSKSSEQSETVPSRQFLEDKKRELTELAEREGGQAITKPDDWGGYILIPRYFEFWQGQSDRLHDRIVFEKEEQSWTLRRLSP